MVYTVGVIGFQRKEIGCRDWVRLSLDASDCVWLDWIGLDWVGLNCIGYI